MLRIVLFAALLPLVCAGQEPSPDRLFAGALEAQQRGDFAQAASQYQPALKLQPDLFGAWANLGVVLVRLGRFNEAVEAYRAALKLNPANAHSTRRAPRAICAKHWS